MASSVNSALQCGTGASVCHMKEKFGSSTSQISEMDGKVQSEALMCGRLLQHWLNQGPRKKRCLFYYTTT